MTKAIVPTENSLQSMGGVNSSETGCVLRLIRMTARARVGIASQRQG
jgi:hypothetical protein